MSHFLQSFVGLSIFAALLIMPRAMTAQCTRDTDCKGDRICVDGNCKSPNESIVNINGSVVQNNNQNVNVVVEFDSEGRFLHRGAPTSPTPLWERTVTTSPWPNEKGVSVMLTKDTLPSLGDCGVLFHDFPRANNLYYSVGPHETGDYCPWKIHESLFQLPGFPEQDRKMIGQPIVWNIGPYKFVAIIRSTYPSHPDRCVTDDGGSCLKIHVDLFAFDQNVKILYH